MFAVLVESVVPLIVNLPSNPSLAGVRMTIMPDTRLLALNYQPRSFGLIITPLPGQARALEGDKLAIEGWVPIVPHDGMLKNVTIKKLRIQSSMTFLEIVIDGGLRYFQRQNGRHNLSYLTPLLP